MTRSVVGASGSGRLFLANSLRILISTKFLGFFGPLKPQKMRKKRDFFLKILPRALENFLISGYTEESQFHYRKEPTP